MWEAQRQGLSDAYKIVTWDLRGHGESGTPDDPAQYSHDLMLGVRWNPDNPPMYEPPLIRKG